MEIDPRIKQALELLDPRTKKALKLLAPVTADERRRLELAFGLEPVTDGELGKFIDGYVGELDYLVAQNRSFEMIPQDAAGKKKVEAALTAVRRLNKVLRKVPDAMKLDWAIRSGMTTVHDALERGIETIPGLDAYEGCIEERTLHLLGKGSPYLPDSPRAKMLALVVDGMTTTQLAAAARATGALVVDGMTTTQLAAATSAAEIKTGVSRFVDDAVARGVLSVKSYRHNANRDAKQLAAASAREILLALNRRRAVMTPPPGGSQWSRLAAILHYGDAGKYGEMRNACIAVRKAAASPSLLPIGPASPVRERRG